MIKYKMMEDRINPSKLYGAAYERHPKGKSLIILLGRRQHVFYTGVI